MTVDWDVWGKGHYWGDGSNGKSSREHPHLRLPAHTFQKKACFLPFSEGSSMTPVYHTQSGNKIAKLDKKSTSFENQKYGILYTYPSCILLSVVRKPTCAAEGESFSD